MYAKPGTTWANEMNFGMHHAPGAGLIARNVDLQSSILTLSYTHVFPSMKQNRNVSQENLSLAKCKFNYKS